MIGTEVYDVGPRLSRLRFVNILARSQISSGSYFVKLVNGRVSAVPVLTCYRMEGSVFEPS